MKKVTAFITASLLFCSHHYAFGITESTSELTASQNRKLTHKNVMLLNTSLQQNPTATLRIKMSAQVVEKALASLEQVKAKSQSEQKQFVTKQLHAILKPVEQFFDVIVEYSGMVLPLLEESLLNHNQLSNSLLVRYFQSKQGIKPFCEKEITSITLLEQLCKELSGFFGDLQASFSPGVEASYKELMKKIKR